MVKYKDFRLGDLFEVYSPQKRFNANAVTVYDTRVENSYRYIVRTSLNNGMRGYIVENPSYLSPENTIAFGQDTATMFYQDEPYFTGDKIKVMKLKTCPINERTALFLITQMQKAFSSFSWGQSSFNEKILNNVILSLPVTSSGEPDFDYMRERIAELERERIAELERERIAELERYLIAAGLENCELTDEDKHVLIEKKEYEEFRMGDIFEHQPSTYYGKGKRNDDISDVPTNEYCIPVLSAKRGDNGICRWAKKGQFKTYKNVISIVYNGAIAAGLTYAQSDEVGILTDSYVITTKQATSFLSKLYMASVIQKAIYPKYSRENKAVWHDRVENDKIKLPIIVTKKPDFDYMERYIKAIEKTAIQDVVAEKDKMIAEIKKIVS